VAKQAQFRPYVFVLSCVWALAGIFLHP